MARSPWVKGGLLDRRGRGEGDDGAAAPEAWEDESPVLAGLAAASVQGTVATGRQRGVRIRRVGNPPETVETPEPGRCHDRWADGTTHLVLDPVEFLSRLAVLVPRPQINLVLYHGVLGPRAAWRSEIVRREASARPPWSLG
jgi:hypothetical protein